jgi:hypothetical protein
MVSAEALLPKGRKVRCNACQHVWHQMPEDGIESQDTKDALNPDLNADPNVESKDEDFNEILKSTQEAVQRMIKQSHEKPKEISKIKAKLTSITQTIFSFGFGSSCAVFLWLIVFISLYAMPNLYVRHFPPIISFYKKMGSEYKIPGADLAFDSLQTHIEIKDHSESADKKEHDEGGNAHLKITGNIINLSKEKLTIPTPSAMIFQDQEDAPLLNIKVPLDVHTIDPEAKVPFVAQTDFILDEEILKNRKKTLSLFMRFYP